MAPRVTRRHFVKTAVGTTAVASILPSTTLGLGRVPASERITVAIIGCGIWPAPGSARQTITRNTIYRTGRSGIDGVYSNKDIGYNNIFAFGLINTDLGAIYAANKTDLTGSRIHHNWLHDAGNDAGHPFPVGAGIYFDQNAKPAQIDHNVFWNNHCRANGDGRLKTFSTFRLLPVTDCSCSS